ncbi:hypothetical protein PG994_013185 [Apiospora phragmitis]|uniref:Uncharacterized protein n=1 Tax=Apiospora phragmitis TaxID=2905665 RepID=A0ABR1T7Y1_9PEZI
MRIMEEPLRLARTKALKEGVWVERMPDKCDEGDFRHSYLKDRHEGPAGTSSSGSPPDRDDRDKLAVDACLQESVVPFVIASGRFPATCTALVLAHTTGFMFCDSEAKHWTIDRPEHVL